jgi:hypothetical protein
MTDDFIVAEMSPALLRILCLGTLRIYVLVASQGLCHGLLAWRLPA